MELWQALETRTTVRSFSDRPVDRGLIVKAVQAALRAPAYNHLWEWGFVLLSDATRRREIVDAMEIKDVTDREALWKQFGTLPEEVKRIYLRALPVQRTMLLSAPEVIAAVYRCKKNEWNPRTPADLNAHAAIWMAIAYLLLSLAEDGLQSCTLVPGDTSAAKHLLGLPDGWEIAVLLPVGYPLRMLVRKEHPSDASAFIHVDRFTGFTLPTTAEPMG